MVGCQNVPRGEAMTRSKKITYALLDRLGVEALEEALAEWLNKEDGK